MCSRDDGVIHKLYALIIVMWIGICWSVLLAITKAGYVDQYLEDCLTQANLASLLVDPYYYGSTGELVFYDTEATRQLFEEILQAGLGDEGTRQKLGIGKEVSLLDFRLYEVTTAGITEFIYDAYGKSSTKRFPLGKVVCAPDGTRIQSSSIYAKISVPVVIGFGIENTAIKEHCVDMVSEEIEYEEN